MAERRMFAKSIVLSDAFLDMPLSARCLYFTLGMMADDDGFVGSPKAIMRQCGASQDDMLVLLQKRYVLAFESGVIVIKHWRMNNYLQSDRKKDTTYKEELGTLVIDEKGAYTEADKGLYTKCIQTVYTGKDSIGKDRKEKRGFNPPTLEEVIEYANKRGNKVDPYKFFDYYTAGNWIDGKGNPVKNWKQKMITWETKRPDTQQTNKRIHNFNERKYDFDELMKGV